MWMLLLLSAALVFDIPLLGRAPSDRVLQEVAGLAGVIRTEARAEGLRIELAPEGELRLSELDRSIRKHTVETQIDHDRLPLGGHTIFQLDAGQCFFCAERPLSQRLARRSVVRSWSVVDYAARGRMRFRIQPSGAATLDALGRFPVEDIIFTARYDGVERVNLYWPTGGVAWRPDERAARQEASASRRPLLIFPTAGT